MTMSDLGPHERLERAEAVLGHEFADPALLERARTHPSYSSEPNCQCDYERLEFLGDAVLGVIITDHAFHAYPDLSEGELTDVRKAVVNAVTLAEVADALGKTVGAVKALQHRALASLGRLWEQMQNEAADDGRA